MAYTGTKAQAGRGTTIGIGTTPTLIGECSDIPFNTPEWQFVDATNFDSGLDQEMIPTIRNAATFTIKGNRVAADAGQIAVEAAYNGPTLVSFTVTLPKSAAQTTSGDKYVFNAYVKAKQFQVSPTSKIGFSMVLQTSGPVVYTAGT